MNIIYSEKTIIVKCWPGVTVYTAMEEAQKIADALECDVEIIHNERRFIVHAKQR